MLWGQFNMYTMFVYNRDKYIFVQALLPVEVFDAICIKIKSLSSDLDDLMTEVHSHRDLVVVRLKTFVDERTQMIVDYAQHTRKIAPPKTQTIELKITRTIQDDGRADLSRQHLPKLVTADTNTYDVFGGHNTRDHLTASIEHMKQHNMEHMYKNQTQVFGGEADHELEKYVVNKTQHMQEIEDVYAKKRFKRQLKSRRKRRVLPTQQVRTFYVYEDCLGSL